MSTPARRRVERLLAAARRIADPGDPAGRRARTALRTTTGLSDAGIELGFEHLETEPSSNELDGLCASVPAAAHAHVLLSANVFIAAHRAIALALAASERVSVRPSRRDPVVAELLCELAGGFDLVAELAPEPGAHVWAYGGDETLDSVAARLPSSVVFHGHGSGVGVAVIEPSALDAVERVAAARGLARDIAVFDQRGCLSPRVAVFSGTHAEALEFARSTAAALDELERRVPCGELDSAERAAIVRYWDTAAFAGDVFPAGRGIVSVDDASALLVPPGGRNLRVAVAADPERVVSAMASALTTIGTACSARLRSELAAVAPGARMAVLGEMQKPPFDGPVDRRTR